MKITKRQLQYIIKEELSMVLQEVDSETRRQAQRLANRSRNLGPYAKPAGLLGKFASRFAGPVGLALGMHDIYQGLQDPNFWTGLTGLAGEEAAYNTWRGQQAEAGNEVPTYEEYLAKKARLEASGQM